MTRSLMRPLIRPLVAAGCLALAFATQPAAAKPELGKPAPAFSVSDTTGKTWSLKDLSGQGMILEWTNHDCPYVEKHYGSGNMQALQQEARNAGYAWLSVISSAPGKQGHVTPAQADALTKDRGASPTAVLLDEEGAMGRAWGPDHAPSVRDRRLWHPGLHGRDRRPGHHQSVRCGGRH